MEEELARMGVRTIGVLAALDPSRLGRRLGTHGHDLRLLAQGQDDREVVSEGEGAKSVGREHTFDTDTADLATLRRTLLALADDVARRLRKSGLRARTVTLKYRDETFRTLTRAESFHAATDSAEALFEAAWALLNGVRAEEGAPTTVREGADLGERAPGPRRVRLLGLSTSGFGDAAQLDLFPEGGVDRVLDAVTERFGAGALTRASLLRDEPASQRQSRTAGGKAAASSATPRPEERGRRR
jgi:DNA polymerase-4